MANKPSLRSGSELTALIDDCRAAPRLRQRDRDFLESVRGFRSVSVTQFGWLLSIANANQIEVPYSLYYDASETFAA